MHIDLIIDDNSIKHTNGMRSMSAIIEDLVTPIIDSTRQKCKKVIRYMRAFILDLIRAIYSFESFIKPLIDLEFNLRIWEVLNLKIPILSLINIQNLLKLRPIYVDNTTPNLLV